MKINPLKISVSICTKNRENDLMKCIDSVLQQTHIPNEIIIVDADSNEKMKLIIKPLCENKSIVFKYIKQTQGRLSVARNISVNNVANDTDIILFLDDDVILDKGYIEEILTLYTSDTAKRTKGVGGVNLNLTINRIQNIVCKFFMLTYHTNKIKVLLSGSVTFPTKIKKVESADVLFGYNMSYRKEIFNEFNFNEVFDYVDDIDFSYRVSRKYILNTDPNAKVYHNHNPIRNYEKQIKMYTYGRYYLFHKLMPKTSKNELCFIWSLFGQFIGYFLMFLIKPSKINLFSMNGSLKGCIMILKNRSCNNIDVS